MKYLNIEDELKYYSKRYNLKKEIENMFTEEGYSHIELSVFETPDKLINIFNKIKKKSIVKVLDGSSNLLILRTDNTTSIIKDLISKWQEGLKLKLFYNSTVFRNKSNLSIKEIRQLGIEYLGEAAIEADKEVIGLALNILNRFSDGFILEISNSKYIRGLIDVIDINENEREQLKDLIYKKNRFELLEFIKTLNLQRDINDCLINILNLQGDISEIINNARNFYMNKTMEESLEELKTLNDLIEELGYSKYVYFDLSMLMELDYYDGLIFKGYYPNFFKDIICGGRYDSFTEEFGQRVPAIGFSLDLDELTEVCLKNRGGKNGLS